MIFVTVGHQEPFDRLVRAVDLWAAENSELEFFAQIAEGGYLPKHMQYVRWLTAIEFNETIESCSALVAHAGTGTILKALMLGKSVLVLPRRAHMNETRNDHQVGTARHFAAEQLLLSAEDEVTLVSKITELSSWQPAYKPSAYAQPKLINRINDVISR